LLVLTDPGKNRNGFLIVVTNAEVLWETELLTSVKHL